MDPSPLSEVVCRDPDDGNIVAAAVSGRCHYLITGVSDLLVLEKHGGIQILAPKDFCKLEGQRPELRDQS